MYPVTNALNEMKFIRIIKTATCSGTGVPSSGSFRAKEEYKRNALVGITLP